VTVERYKQIELAIKIVYLKHKCTGVYLESDFPLEDYLRVPVHQEIIEFLPDITFQESIMFKKIYRGEFNAI
jgi:hypothetical protein